MSWLKPKEIYSEEDLKVKEVVELMLSSVETLIEINPRTVGLDYILSNEASQYYVMIDDSGVKISNHTFSRDIRMSSFKINTLKELSRTEASKRRNIKEEKIHQNGVELLDRIIKKLKNQ
jgi:hypothetical protein